ncbi:hypothetical protein WJX72_002123 [[Myrmecia] bisecta]|uniref:EF-hand domain-containing protein n=1 Tax=[Myrmecia] bisecta TaxID=41462 RepID=A0AAW1Q6N1_9CHLO
MYLPELEALIRLSERFDGKEEQPSLQACINALNEASGLAAGDRLQQRSELPDTLSRAKTARLLTRLHIVPQERLVEVLDVLSANGTVPLAALTMLLAFVTSANFQEKLHLVFWVLDRDEDHLLSRAEVEDAVAPLLAVAEAAAIVCPPPEDAGSPSTPLSAWDGLRDSMRALATDRIAMVIANGAFTEVDEDNNRLISGSQFEAMIECVAADAAGLLVDVTTLQNRIAQLHGEVQGHEKQAGLKAALSKLLSRYAGSDVVSELLSAFNMDMPPQASPPANYRSLSASPSPQSRHQRSVSMLRSPSADQQGRLSPSLSRSPTLQGQGRLSYSRSPALQNSPPERISLSRSPTALQQRSQSLPRSTSLSQPPDQSGYGGGQFRAPIGAPNPDPNPDRSPPYAYAALRHSELTSPQQRTPLQPTAHLQNAAAAYARDRAPPQPAALPQRPSGAYPRESAFGARLSASYADRGQATHYRSTHADIGRVSAGYAERGHAPHHRSSLSDVGATRLVGDASVFGQPGLRQMQSSAERPSTDLQRPSLSEAQHLEHTMQSAYGQPESAEQQWFENGVFERGSSQSRQNVAASGQQENVTPNWAYQNRMPAHQQSTASTTSNADTGGSLGAGLSPIGRSSGFPSPKVIQGLRPTAAMQESQYRLASAEEAAAAAAAAMKAEMQSEVNETSPQLSDPKAACVGLLTDVSVRMMMVSIVRMLIIFAIVAADGALAILLFTRADLPLEGSLGIVVLFNFLLALLGMCYISRPVNNDALKWASTWVRHQQSKDADGDDVNAAITRTKLSVFEAALPEQLQPMYKSVINQFAGPPKRKRGNAENTDTESLLSNRSGSVQSGARAEYSDEDGTPYSRDDLENQENLPANPIRQQSWQQRRARRRAKPKGQLGPNGMLEKARKVWSVVGKMAGFEPQSATAGGAGRAPSRPGGFGGRFKFGASQHRKSESDASSADQRVEMREMRAGPADFRSALPVTPDTDSASDISGSRRPLAVRTTLADTHRRGAGPGPSRLAQSSTFTSAYPGMDMV